MSYRRHAVPQRPPLQQRVAPALHPSNRGRCHGYSEPFRQLVMAIRQAGASHHPLLTQLRAAHLFPLLITEDRWNNLLTSSDQSWTLSKMPAFGK